MAGGVAVMGAFSPKGDIPGNPRCNGRDTLGKHMQTNVMRQQDSHSNHVHDVASRGNPSGHICAHHTLLGGGSSNTRQQHASVKHAAGGFATTHDLWRNY